MTFAKWLDTFLAEKEIDGDDMLTVEGSSGTNFIPVEILADAIKSASPAEQAGIKSMLAKIDFVAPGRKPVLDYFTHLGKAIAT